MGTRGYRIERQVATIDTNGVPIDVTTGLVPDQYGNIHVGLGIGDAPTALLTAEQVIELIALLSLSAIDLGRLEDDPR